MILEVLTHSGGTAGSAIGFYLQAGGITAWLFVGARVVRRGLARGLTG